MLVWLCSVHVDMEFAKFGVSSGGEVGGKGMAKAICGEEEWLSIVGMVDVKLFA